MQFNLEERRKEVGDLAELSVYDFFHMLAKAENIKDVNQAALKMIEEWAKIGRATNQNINKELNYFDDLLEDGEFMNLVKRVGRSTYKAQIVLVAATLPRDSYFTMRVLRERGEMLGFDIPWLRNNPIYQMAYRGDKDVILTHPIDYTAENLIDVDWGDERARNMHKLGPKGEEFLIEMIGKMKNKEIIKKLTEGLI